MTRRLIGVGAFAVAFLVTVVGPATAEPIKLTSGGISYYRPDLAHFRFDNGGVVFDGNFGSAECDCWQPSYACFGCTPGKTINVSVTERFPNNDPHQFVLGTFKVQDTLYFVDSLSFQIDAGDVVVPHVSGDERLFVTTDAGPFVFRGTLSGTSDLGSLGSRRTFDFIGAGRGSITFLGGGEIGTSYFASSYGFRDLAPTPEPGTLLLLCTAVALIAFRRTYART
jgi:hypothetical protein